MRKPMRTIEIDDEVFAYLQRHSEPLVDTPNDVLRRQLLNNRKPPADKTESRRTGGLMAIIEAGLATAGDRVRHHQPRLRRTHEGTITADGWIEIPDGRAFPQPSPALKEQTGVDINGWRQYTHVPSGRRLEDLREEAAKRQT
ncbi:hypothetical protein ACFRCG_30885 [Embleya sp. NPDC056575]|uniref:restriction system modified-DNA reader domain-containing protein n=1 Tax=unclassified Embleya TaxID=2699296 RepID=UPI0036846F35